MEGLHSPHDFPENLQPAHACVVVFVVVVQAQAVAVFACGGKQLSWGYNNAFCFGLFSQFNGVVLAGEFNPQHKPAFRVTYQCAFRKILLDAFQHGVAGLAVFLPHIAQVFVVAALANKAGYCQLWQSGAHGTGDVLNMGNFAGNRSPGPY